VPNVEANNLTLVTTIVGVCTGLVAVGTLVKSVLEYVKQGSSKRAEQFLLMRSRLRGNAEFVEICELLDENSSKLRDMPLLRKDNFIGFFEELYLQWNSRVFNDEVVYYMFGYFAIACWESDNFWHGLNRDSPTWAHFKAFVACLVKIKRNYRPDRSRFRV
jgi:hypothetical protein